VASLLPERCGKPELPRIRALQTWAEAQGFRGEYLASEYNFGANYPEAAKPHWWGDADCSELQKAKYVAQVSTIHTALGIGSFFCEVWGNDTYPHDLSLMRRAFHANPYAALQPQAAYYAMRNLATALDGCRPASFECSTTGAPDGLLLYPMERHGERVVALWLPDLAVDDCPGIPISLHVPGTATRAIGYDCLTGMEQELASCPDREGTIVRGVLVRDYPLLLRFQHSQASDGGPV
jgi:hypothetical protein